MTTIQVRNDPDDLHCEIKGARGTTMPDLILSEPPRLARRPFRRNCSAASKHALQSAVRRPLT